MNVSTGKELTLLRPAVLEREFLEAFQMLVSTQQSTDPLQSNCYTGV